MFSVRLIILEVLVIDCISISIALLLTGSFILVTHFCLNCLNDFFYFQVHRSKPDRRQLQRACRGAAEERRPLLGRGLAQRVRRCRPGRVGAGRHLAGLAAGSGRRRSFKVPQCSLYNYVPTIFL